MRLKMMRRGMWAVGAVLATVGAAGCGGSTSHSSTSSAPSSSSAAPATPAATSSTSAAGTSTAAASSSTSSGAPAKPGASFAVGQAAIVNFQPSAQESGPPTTRLMVTVDSIKKGTLADFNGIQLDASEKAGLPEYVTLHVTNVGSKPAEGDDITADIQGVDNTGNLQSAVVFLGDFPKCNDTSTQAPVAPGKSLGTCLTFLVPGGITKVAYTGDDDYEGTPVTWK